MNITQKMWCMATGIGLGVTVILACIAVCDIGVAWMVYCGS